MRVASVKRRGTQTLERLHTTSQLAYKEAKVQKEHNTLPYFISLLSDHIKSVSEFDRRTNIWMSSSGNDLYYHSITDSIFKPKLLSVPVRVMAATHEICNSNVYYVIKLQKLSSVLVDLERERIDKQVW